MKRAGLILSALLIAFTSVVLYAPKHAQAAVASDFDPSNIISDTAFFDSSTMDPNAIQAFLDAKVPNCTGGTCLKNYTQPVPNVGGDAFCSYIGGNGTVYSAAQMIYIVAKSCGINPQVILVKLQKEQGLITDSKPPSSRIDIAMGYACPDTARCDPEYFGFFRQIFYGSRQLIRYGAEPQKFNYAVGRNSYIAYQALKPECGGTYITPQTRATAALYNYTPYQPNGAAMSNLYGLGDGCSAYGNRNFWRNFTDWFGSPHGDLVRTVNNGTVYLISGEAKYPISDVGVLNDFGVLGPLRYVSDQYIGNKNTGPVLRRMIQGPDLSLYVVNAGIKLPLTSCGGDVIDYGYTCATDQFAPLTAGQASRFYTGPAVTKLLRSNTNGTIYYMQNGKKRPILGWGDLVSLNVPLSYNVLTDSFVNSYPTGPNLHGVGALVRTPSNATVYLIKDLTTLYPISSFIYPQEMGLNTGVRIINEADLQSYTVTSANLQNKIVCGSTNYVATNGSLYSVSAPMMGVYGYNSGQFVAGGGLCTNVNISAQPLGHYIRNSSGTIYFVNMAGQKQAFTSMNAYVSHQAQNGNPGFIQVSDFFTNTLANGSNI